MAEVELMKRGSGYILKVGATRTCYKLNVGGERKSQGCLQAFGLNDWKMDGTSVKGAGIRGSCQGLSLGLTSLR